MMTFNVTLRRAPAPAPRDCPCAVLAICTSARKKQQAPASQSGNVLFERNILLTL
jgi:hypothetical protein